MKIPKKKWFINNKLKITYGNNILNQNNKEIGKRKLKPDDIRKKIKARFLKSLKSKINQNYMKLNLKKF